MSIKGAILPVSTSNNLRLGTLGVALVEHAHSCSNILRRGILGKKVLAQSSCVGSSNTLAAQITTQLERKVIADFGSNNGALKGDSD